MENRTLLIIPIGAIELTRKECENVHGGIYFISNDTLINKRPTVKH